MAWLTGTDREERLIREKDSALAQRQVSRRTPARSKALPSPSQPQKRGEWAVGVRLGWAGWARLWCILRYVPLDGRTDYAMLLGVPVRMDKVCQACRPGWPIRGSRLASVGIACWIERSWTVNSHNFFCIGRSWRRARLRLRAMLTSAGMKPACLAVPNADLAGGRGETCSSSM